MPGITLMIEDRIEACGKLTPNWWQKDEAQAPPAITTVVVAIVPRSVTTPDTCPPDSSSPRAAQV